MSEERRGLIQRVAEGISWFDVALFGLTGFVCEPELSRMARMARWAWAAMKDNDVNRQLKADGYRFLKGAWFRS